MRVHARSPLGTLAAALAFVLLALAWTYPLGAHLSTHIPGASAGDNVAALWNFWWARFATAHGLTLWRTDYLFAPAGTSLLLHANLALPVRIGAYMLPMLPLVAAHNVLLIATLTLNGMCAFWLVRRLTNSWDASIIGALVFAGSPFVDAHLLGHFNVLSVWTLPLVALLTLDAVAGSRRAAHAAGLVIGLTVYLDYYYAVYALALAAGLAMLARGPVTMTYDRNGARRPRLEASARWVALATLVVVCAILVTGGVDVSLGPLRIDATDPFNGLQLLWLLIAGWAWLRWHPHLHLTSPVGERLSWRPVAAAAALAWLVAAPVWIGLVRLALDGDYTAPAPYWRSGGAGVDLATLFLGNPFSAALGGWTRDVLARATIDPVERTAWLGLAPLALAVVAARAAPRPLAMPWILVGGGALLWSLGPHLSVFGWNTGMILPHALLRYLPILSNARVPGRAMAVVFLALGALSGLGWAALRRRGVSWWWGVAVVALLVVDFLPAPIPLVFLEHPAVYDTLKAAPQPGALLELPIGFRDGFGEAGGLDHRVLWYQSIHERPLVGGFVARLSPSTRRVMAGNRLLADVIALSEPRDPAAPDVASRVDALADLYRLGVAFVLLDRSHASRALQDYVDGVLAADLIAADGPRSLYRVGASDAGAGFGGAPR